MLYSYLGGIYIYIYKVQIGICTLANAHFYDSKDWGNVHKAGQVGCMHALPKPVTTLSHSSSIESSLEQYLPPFRPPLVFTALTVLSALLVPTMGRAEINIDKVMWIAENGIGLGHIKTYIT